MTDDTKNCVVVAKHLEDHYPDLKDAVLVIHTKKNGEISEATSGKAKQELKKLREQPNKIDESDSPYKAIVSVLMLKEGWDIRNVTTIPDFVTFVLASADFRGFRRKSPMNPGRPGWPGAV